jgi:hypothetical protein
VRWRVSREAMTNKATTLEVVAARPPRWHRGGRNRTRRKAPVDIGTANSGYDEGDQTPGASSVESWSTLDVTDTPRDALDDFGFASDTDVPEMAHNSEGHRRGVQLTSEPIACGQICDVKSVAAPLAWQSHSRRIGAVVAGCNHQYSVAAMMAVRDLSHAMPWHCVRDIPTAIQLLRLPDSCDEADSCILATTPSDSASIASGAVTPSADGPDTEASDEGAPEVTSGVRPARWKRGGRKLKKPSSPSDASEPLMHASRHSASSNLGAKRVMAPSTRLGDRPFT